MRHTEVWALYCRTNLSKRRKRVMEYNDHGEACAALCRAVLLFPGRAWKLRKVKRSICEVGA